MTEIQVTGSFHIKPIKDANDNPTGAFGVWLTHQGKFFEKEDPNPHPLPQSKETTYQKQLAELKSDRSGETAYVLRPHDEIITAEGSIIFEEQKGRSVRLAMSQKTFAKILLAGNTLTAKTSGLHLVENPPFGTGVAVEVIDSTTQRSLLHASNDSMVQAEVRRVMQRVEEAIKDPNKEEAVSSLEKLGFSNEEAVKYTAAGANFEVSVPKPLNATQPAPPERKIGAVPHPEIANADDAPDQPAKAAADIKIIDKIQRIIMSPKELLGIVVDDAGRLVATSQPESRDSLERIIVTSEQPDGMLAVKPGGSVKFEYKGLRLKDLTKPKPPTGDNKELDYEDFVIDDATKEDRGQLRKRLFALGQSVMQDISLAIAKGDSKALVALVALGFSEKDAQDYIAKQTEVVVPKLIGVDSGEAPAAGSPFMIDKDGKKRAVATPPFETNMTQALDKEQERLKSIRESDPNHPKPKPPQTSDESYQEAAAKNQQLGGNGANLAILLEENKKTAQAGEGLRSADIGVPTATGISLYKHKQHENLRDKNEGPVREDGLITKRISLLEMSFLSDIAMNGNEFVDDDKAAHATARARVKKALDIDGDGIVQVEEIDKAKQALQHAGVIMEVDAEALATTLNTGKLPQKQRDIR